MLSIESEYMPLSESDTVLIKSNLYPKMKRMVLCLSVGLLSFNIVAPFLGGRFGRRPAIETMGYPKAFLYFSVLFGCLFLYVYWSVLIALRRDLMDGRKCIFRTKISLKVWKSHDQFELFLDKVPKGLLRKKFIYSVTESHNFHKGDVIKLEYLERSGMLLKISAE